MDELLRVFRRGSQKGRGVQRRRGWRRTGTCVEVSIWGFRVGFRLEALYASGWVWGIDVRSVEP